MRLTNGEELIIEEAQPKDASNILTYLNQIGGESHNLTFGEDEFQLTIEEEENMLQSILDHPLNAMWKGCIDGTLVSICNVQSFPNKKEAHRGSISISVIKSHWHMGIARAMLSHLLAYVQQKPEIEILTLEVVSDNTHAIHLYESLGFQIQGIYHKFTKVDGQYYDAYYMEKEIQHQGNGGTL